MLLLSLINIIYLQWSTLARGPALLVDLCQVPFPVWTTRVGLDVLPVLRTWDFQGQGMMEVQCQRATWCAYMHLFVCVCVCVCLGSISICVSLCTGWRCYPQKPQNPCRELWQSLQCLGKPGRQARRPVCRRQRLGSQRVLVAPAPSLGCLEGTRGLGGPGRVLSNSISMEKGMAGSGLLWGAGWRPGPRCQCSAAKFSPAVAQESDINKRVPGTAGPSYCRKPWPLSLQPGFGGFGGSWAHGIPGR